MRSQLFSSSRSQRSSSPRAWRALVAAGAAGVVLLAGACSSSSSSNGSSANPTTTTYPAVVKVGPDPSISSKMVCGTEGQAVIAAALNETPTKVTTPTWKNDLYSCEYVYPKGTMSIAVKELPTRAATLAYFASLQKQYGLKQSFELGQGAFISPQAVVIARKDYKVLTVDPTKLPVKFGEPPTTRDNISVQTAGALMGCWTGA